MHHCGNFIPRALSRREMLARCANGFGAIALTALLADKSFGGWAKTVWPALSDAVLSEGTRAAAG